MNALQAAVALVGLVVFSAAAAGCAKSIEGLYPPAPAELVQPIYVIDHGWMTVDRPTQRRPDGNIVSMMKDENHYELTVGDKSRSGGQWEIPDPREPLLESRARHRVPVEEEAHAHEVLRREARCRVVDLDDRPRKRESQLEMEVDAATQASDHQPVLLELDDR